jgi:CSLREA domain-containing protein
MKINKNFKLRLSLLLLIISFSAICASAVTLTVNLTGDSLNFNAGNAICINGAPCTLRAAIQEANNNPGDDEIVFDPSVFSTQQTITLTNQLPQITNNLIITGTSPALLTISGDDMSRVFFISSGTVSISNLTVANGAVGESSGAGIRNNGNLTLTNLIVRNNTNFFGQGGGIYNDTNAQLNVDNTLIYENITNDVGDGAGICNSNGVVIITNSAIYNNQIQNSDNGSNGGGIANFGNLILRNNFGGVNNGTISITDSTIRDNTVNDNGGGIYNEVGTINIIRSTIGSLTKGNSNRAANGGGIYNLNGTVNLTNSTISGNFAGNIGGGYYGFGDAGTTTLSAGNATIAFNMATTGGGLAVSSVTGFNSTATINNTIIAQNNADTGPDVFANTLITVGGLGGSILSNGYNLVQNPADGGIMFLATDINSDPLLLPLSNNGGATQTHALMVGSPAIDKGNSSLMEDQRGLPRPIDNPAINPATLGNDSDIGGVEVQTPTAASVYINGRFTEASGRGLSRIRVILTESNGTSHSAVTNSFGYFRFTDISVGQSVTVQGIRKGWTIEPRLVSVENNIDDLNFIVTSASLTKAIR